jgi:hypothetical protein
VDDRIDQWLLPTPGASHLLSWDDPPSGGYIGQDQSWDEDPEAPAKSAKSPAILLVYFYSKQQGTKGLTHIFST